MIIGISANIEINTDYIESFDSKNLYVGMISGDSHKVSSVTFNMLKRIFKNEAQFKSWVSY